MKMFWTWLLWQMRSGSRNIRNYQKTNRLLFSNSILPSKLWYGIIDSVAIKLPAPLSEELSTRG